MCVRLHMFSWSWVGRIILPGTFHGGGWLNTESTVPFLHDLLSEVRRGMNPRGIHFLSPLALPPLISSC